MLTPKKNVYFMGVLSYVILDSQISSAEMSDDCQSTSASLVLDKHNVNQNIDAGRFSQRTSDRINLLYCRAKQASFEN